MTALSPKLLAERIGHGLLSFPVTHFDQNLEFDEAAYRDHLSWQSKYDVAGLFAAGGTGEFFSLTPAEVDRVVRVAVDEVNGAVPLLAPAGQSVALARQQVKNAEEAGADGILLFPPYLTEASKAGIASYVEAICSATNLGVILYNRANGRIDAPTLERLAASCPNLIGFKDGVGDIELMTQIYARLGDRFTYIGGLPTAETFALPYLRLGVTTYSSAIFNFAPEFALGYYDSVTSGDVDAVYTKLREFVLPYLEVRNRVAGYAVSIVKAGLAAAGRPGSLVRPPLLDLTPADLADLTELVARVK